MSVVAVLQGNDWLFFSVAVVLGLLVGSFLNVIIKRMPPILEYQWKQDYADFTEQEFNEKKPPGIALARSHCPQCKNQLAAWHNIPVISFMLLRGRCHFCHKAISWRYPAIEFLTAALTLMSAWHFGVSWQFLAVVMMCWLLIAITFIDLDTFLIPDQLSLTLLWLGLFVSLFDYSITPAVAVKGALVGYLSLWLIFHLFKLATGKDAMGYGDFKLLAAGGAWLGMEMLIVVLMIASVAGLLMAALSALVGKGQQKIPFGPYLSVGILVGYFYKQPILSYLFPGLG